MIQNVGPMVFIYTDINQAYEQMQMVKGEFTDWEETRNGRAMAFQYPVLLHSPTPQRRVLFCPIRNANPFFHYMEAIWMLSGSENVDFPSYFAKNIKDYSDDGVTLHGAYGYRWKHHFEVDQIESVIYELATNPTSRRMVVAMWDPQVDLEKESKDIPCNTHLYFRVVQGALSMTVLNRSNDMVWGMLGANYVHFSILQEYMAEAAHLEIGAMYQFTNNLHVYQGWEDKFGPMSDWYRANPVIRRWLFGPENLNLEEAAHFVEHWSEYEDHIAPKCRILRDNAFPMLMAWDNHKDGNYDLALHYAAKIWDDDWRHACENWLKRQMIRKSGVTTTKLVGKNTGTE